jgi:hypothetical protein
VFLDWTKKDVDKFRLAMRKAFDLKGNADSAGVMRDNHISQAIGYFKHDEHAVFHHSGQAHWLDLIENARVFVKSGPAKVLKERMSYPVLTYANLLKQAVKFQQDRCPSTFLLKNVLENMVNDANWFPSRELLRNGVPKEMHERFFDMVKTKKRTRQDWMLPHDPSEKKSEWLDRPDRSWCPACPSSTGAPGDSKRLWKDKDFSDPS